jgi:hypothetical protein
VTPQFADELIDRSEVLRLTKWRVRELCTEIGATTTVGSPGRSLRSEIRLARVSDPEHDRLTVEFLSEAIANGTLQIWAQRSRDGSQFAVPPPTIANAKVILEDGYLDRARLPQAAQAYHGWPWGLSKAQLENWLANPALPLRIMADLSVPSGASVNPPSIATNPVSTPSPAAVPAPASPPPPAAVMVGPPPAQQLKRQPPVRQTPAAIVVALKRAADAGLVPSSKTGRGWSEYLLKETKITRSPSRALVLAKQYCRSGPQITSCSKSVWSF